MAAVLEPWIRHTVESLRPDWRFEADLRPADIVQPPKLIGEKHQRLRAIARRGPVQIDCQVYGYVPETLTLTGAVHITGRPPVGSATARAESHPVIATVVRLQLVSIVVDHRPSANIDNPDPRVMFTRPEPIAGTEWFYELAQPPETLHWYRPREGETGLLRQELLLVDLDTE
ncbi:hypothetical protein AAFP30_14875 [Gordonia sp. CPCC 205515]|uniref:hypothetical protein n=1 Tax=Gordonia sp. CPCC 205515 TaxID=3140791 RepID=UPI003AF368C5